MFNMADVHCRIIKQLFALMLIIYSVSSIPSFYYGPYIFDDERLQDLDIEGVEIAEAEERLHDDEFPLGIPEEEKNVPGEPLTPQDFENARKIDIQIPLQDENSPDPLESAGLFEGDIAGVNFSDINTIPTNRNAIRDLSLRWPMGIIPYVISAAYSSYERSVIAAAFVEYHERTYIRFVPRTTQQDYIYILKGAGCSSAVGRNGRGQQVSLGAGCVYRGIVIHELMHAVGFWHEQSRADRDDFISILWHNVQRGMEFNFQKFNWNMMQPLGAPYDISSVMHYGMYAFSKDHRSPTIVPKQAGVQLVGQRSGFSEIDLVKVNRLYQCQNGVSGATLAIPEPPTTEKCSDNNRHCSYWKSIGECAKNPAWMLVNCAKACRQCGRRCANYNKNCVAWASIGECSKNPAYMTIYCPKACDTCKEGNVPDQSCTDKNRYCEAWARDNQCKTNPNYMLHFCKKSCKQC